MNFLYALWQVLEKRFNKQDVNASMLFSVDYGIATDAIDPTLRTKESTVMKQAMRSQLMIEKSWRGASCFICCHDACKGKAISDRCKGSSFSTTWKTKSS